MLPRSSVPIRVNGPAGTKADGGRSAYHYTAAACGAPSVPKWQTPSSYCASENRREEREYATMSYQPREYDEGRQGVSGAVPFPGWMVGSFRDPVVQPERQFSEQVHAMLYQRPLVIHTQVLPPGVKPDDPRLPHARVLSERHYVADFPVLPAPTYTASLHPALLAPAEPPHRIVRAISAHTTSGSPRRFC